MTVNNKTTRATTTLALALAGAVSTPAQATTEFNLLGIEFRSDNQVRAGVGVRTSEQEEDFIAQGNLGPEFAFSNTGSSTNNGDDGNLNFEQGDIFSQSLSGRTELSAEYNPNSATFSSFGGEFKYRYSHDFKLRDGDFATDPVGQQRHLTEEGRDNASSGQILDAYVYSDMWLGNVPVEVRYGKQVVNWGESTFILGGINQTNPIDVSAFRKPGAEVKDVLLPAEMLYASAGVTNNLTVEGYFQTKWEPFEIEDCGTFFSTVDVVSDGCGPLLLAGQAPDSQALEDGLFAEREADQEPDDTGQFGLSARYFLPDSGIELGAYYMRFHSRLPLLNVRANNPEDGNTTANVDYDPDKESTRFPNYFVEYPEDLEVMGLSLNTTIPTGTSVGAEYSFQPDKPVQRNSTDVIFAGLQQRGPNGEILSKTEQARREANPDKNFAGEVIRGYDRFDISQLQSTFIHFFDRVMGTDRFIVIGEIGGTYVHGLPDSSEERFGRSATFGAGPLPVEGEDFTGDFCREGPDDEPGANINPSNCRSDGYVTDFSWGYRALFAWDYSSFYMGWNFMPSIFVSHDVKGFAPGPAGNFSEGSKQVGLTAAASYQNRWNVELSYTEYFDGEPYNELKDRDFLSANISYSF
ncbi:MAG: DUF1302 domain-containing protein [Pseudomonadota bacterium]